MTDLEQPLLPYDLWVAAHLFMNTGYAASEVLGRLDIDGYQWQELDDKFRHLQSAGLWWWMVEGWLNAAEDPAFLRHILRGRDIALPKGKFELSQALAEIRATVRANPYIGPFESVRWPATFLAEHYEISGVIYSHNGTNVFFYGKPLADKTGNSLAGIDVQSFRLLSDRWLRDHKRVYAQAQSGSSQVSYYFYVVKDADPESFVALNLRYAKDKNAAYYITNKRIRTHSVGRFSIVPYAVNTIHGDVSDIAWESPYAKDSEQVYNAGIKLANANPEDFKQVSNDGYCNGQYFSDGQKVWFEGKPVDKADAKSFRVTDVAQYSATDKFRPYQRGFPYPVSTSYDQKSWAAYFSRHPELKDYWWYEEDRQRKRLQSFEKKSLGGPYVTDGERVYVSDIWLEDVDLKRFRYLGASFCACGDKLYSYAVYHKGFLDGGLLEDGDPATFEKLEHEWYADKNNAYKVTWRGDAVAVKIHRPTFKIIDKENAQDRDGVVGPSMKRPREKKS